MLVNNAANDDRHDWRDVTPEYFDNRINTNLRHYFFAIQALAPQMIEAGAGSIVNIGSSSYMRKEDFFPGYAIAKSAVEGITRTMARTLGRHGVRVNTVLPGWVPTERQLAKWWTPEGEQNTMDAQEIKRRITPDEFVADGAVPRRRRRRRMHRAALPRRRRPPLRRGGRRARWYRSARCIGWVSDEGCSLRTIRAARGRADQGGAQACPGGW